MTIFRDSDYLRVALLQLLLLLLLSSVCACVTVTFCIMFVPTKCRRIACGADEDCIVALPDNCEGRRNVHRLCDVGVC